MRWSSVALAAVMLWTGIIAANSEELKLRCNFASLDGKPAEEFGVLDIADSGVVVTVPNGKPQYFENGKLVVQDGIRVTLFFRKSSLEIVFGAEPFQRSRTEFNINRSTGRITMSRDGLSISGNCEKLAASPAASLATAPAASGVKAGSLVGKYTCANVLRISDIELRESGNAFLGSGGTALAGTYKIDGETLILSWMTLSVPFTINYGNLFYENGVCTKAQ